MEGAGTDWVELRARLVERFRVLGSVRLAADELGLNRNTAYGWASQLGLRSRRPPHPGREEYHRLRAEGASRREAASQVGVNERTARDWEHGVRKLANGRIYADGRAVDYATGRITMVSVDEPDVRVLERRLHPRFLSIDERERIADLVRAGASLREIGRQLGRPASTVKRELDQRRDVNGWYRPYAAHRHAARRRARPKPARLVTDVRLREFVQAGLLEQWSPEQVSNALRLAFPDDLSMRVSPETIYQALYRQAGSGLRREVARTLRTGRTRRKRRRSPLHRMSRFRDPMVMISERPSEVEDRRIPGHWEGDLIVGTGSQSAIITLVERSSRFVMLGHLPDGHDAEQVRDTLVGLLSELPKHLRRSITWDQGTEMAAHRSLTLATNVPVYFCDPASPWQRGSNENTNGLLRQYFPKGTDLSRFGAADLASVAVKLNRRPRKTLGWETPAQRLAYAHAKERDASGVAVTP